MKTSWSKWVAIILALICFGVAAFFSWKIYSTEKEYAEGDAVYEEIAQAVSVEESEAPDESLESSENEEIIEGQPSNDSILQVDFAELKAINDDVAAWLYLPDTVINYPVAQGTDNHYYLKHLLDGTYNANGCLFFDCNNSLEFTDDNILIYGHHMDSGKMFASLVNYKEQSFYDSHRICYLSTPKNDYKIEIFSGYTTTADSLAYMISWSSREEKIEWLKEMFHNSDFYSDVMVFPYDHIVTFSTCEYSFQNARYVVHGRLVEITEGVDE